MGMKHGMVLALALVTGAGAAVAAEVGPQARPDTLQLAQAVDQATLMREGQALYTKECAACHGRNGQGDMGPKITGNDTVASVGGIIGQIMQGNEDHGMPAFYDKLNDRQIAAIGTFVRNSFGNSYGPVTVAEVAASRK